MQSGTSAGPRLTTHGNLEPPRGVGTVTLCGSAAWEEAIRMTCDRLVCANCAGPVAEGRCSVCRAYRARHHHDSPFGSLTPATLIALLVALIAFALVVHQAT